MVKTLGRGLSLLSRVGVGLAVALLISRASSLTEAAHATPASFDFRTDHHDTHGDQPPSVPTGRLAGAASLTPTLPTQFLFAIQADPDPLGQFGEGPTGVAFGPAGTYVVDRQNGRVTRFDRAGQAELAWGSRGEAQGQLGRNLSVATSFDGTVLVADRDARRVQRFDANGKFLAEYATAWAGDNAEPQDIAVAATGMICLTDGLFQRVVAFAPGSAPITFGKLGEGPGEFNQVAGIAVGNDGSIWVGDAAQGTLQNFTGTGDFVRRVGGGDAGLGDGKIDNVADLAVDRRDGTLLVLHGEPDPRVMRLSPTGAYLASYGKEGKADGELGSPMAIAVDQQGGIVVADPGNGRLQAFGADGKPAGFWGALGSPRRWNENPDGLAFSPDGRSLYATDVYLNEVRRYTPEGQLLGRWGKEGAGPGEFNYATGAAVASDGSVLVADQENHRVQRFAADGRFLGQAGTRGSGDGQFNYVGDVAVTPDDTVLVADIRNQRVAKLGLDLSWKGAVQPAVVPFRLAAVADGSMVVVQRQGHRMGHFSADGHTLAFWGTNGSAPGELDQPDGVTVTKDGWIYLAEPGNRRIDLFSLGGAFAGTWGSRGTGPGEFGSGGLQGNPSDIAVAADGLIYASDSANHRVQVFGTKPLEAWRVAYYGNAFLADTAVVITRTGQLRLDPPPGLRPGAWSARATRQLVTDAAKYELRVRSTGGVRLWLDKQLLMDEWNAAPPQGDLDRDLEAGLHTILVEYNDRAARPELEFSLLPKNGLPRAIFVPWATKP